MYNARKAYLRRQGLSEKQITILDKLEDRMFSLVRKRRAIENKYSKLMDRYHKLYKEYGIKN